MTTETRTWAAFFFSLQKAEDWRIHHAARSTPEILDLVAAWPAVCPVWTPPHCAPPEDQEAAWLRAWCRPEGWDTVIADLASALHWPWNKARALWEACRILRAIYPDRQTSQKLATYGELLTALDLRVLEKKASKLTAPPPSPAGPAGPASPPSPDN